jgi:hypothetical protein
MDCSKKLKKFDKGDKTVEEIFEKIQVHLTLKVDEPADLEKY